MKTRFLFPGDCTLKTYFWIYIPFVPYFTNRSLLILHAGPLSYTSRRTKKWFVEGLCHCLAKSTGSHFLWNSPHFSSCVPGSVRQHEQAKRSPAGHGWGSPWFRSLRTPSWTCSSTESLTYSNIHSVTGGHRVKRHLRHSHTALCSKATGHRGNLH